MALNRTRLSFHDFNDNRVRLQLFVLAYNPGNFLRWPCPQKLCQYRCVRLGAQDRFPRSRLTIPQYMATTHVQKTGWTGLGRIGGGGYNESSCHMPHVVQPGEVSR